MGRFLFVFSMVLFSFIPVSYAGSGELNGIWLLTRDHLQDGVLNPTEGRDEVELAIRMNSHSNKFAGEYAEIKNDSLFTGETFTARNSTVIVLFQYDGGFYVVHSGHKVGPDRYVGIWFASGDLSGDFELRKK